MSRELAVTAAECDAGHELVAVLDCTGGFHTRRRRRGIRLGDLLDRAGLTADASHVRVVSVTGYRWSSSPLVSWLRAGGGPTRPCPRASARGRGARRA